MIHNYRKIYLLALLTFVVFSCSKSKEEKSNLIKPKKPWLITQEDVEEKKALQLGVKKRDAYTYFYDMYGKVAERGDIVEEVFFNEDGLKEKQIRYGGGKMVDREWDFEYDDDGNILIAKTYDHSGKIVYESLNDFNGDGLEESSEVFDANFKKKRFITNSYYKTRITSTTIKAENGDIIERHIYSYNPDSSYSVTKTGARERFLQRTERYFDNKSMLAAEIITDNRPATDTTYFRYDSKGNLILKKNSMYTYTFLYDENNNRVEEVMYYTDKKGFEFKQMKLVYVYGEKGLLYERYRYDSDDNPIIVTRYNYLYY